MPAPSEIFGRLSLKDRMAMMNHAVPGRGHPLEYYAFVDPLTEEIGRGWSNEWTPGWLRALDFTRERAEKAMFAINLLNEGTSHRASPASHYRTRAELEAVSGEEVVQQMISNGVIEIHRKWYRALRNTPGVWDIRQHGYHPQAEYRINGGTLMEVIHPDYYR